MLSQPEWVSKCAETAPDLRPCQLWQRPGLHLQLPLSEQLLHWALLLFDPSQGLHSASLQLVLQLPLRDFHYCLQITT